MLGALLPTFARTLDVRLLRQTLIPLLLMVSGLTLLLALTAPWVMSVFFGADFAPAVEVLQRLAWSLLPYALNATASVVFVARAQTRTVVWAHSVGVVSGAVLMALLVPQWGLVGASYSVLGSEMAQVLVFGGFVLVNRYAPRERN